jgi:cell division protein FtsI (penicillin-binding protein 3)
VEVVRNGTGKRAAIPGYEVAGKTGTAQKWDPKLKCYPRNRYVVSFVGFVPVERPALLGIVVVDDPKVEAKTEYGGAIAAPLFRRIAARTLAYLEVPPNPELLAEAVSDRERPPDER